MAFFLEVLIGGLLVGVLYSLVALGFVLIFKASGVFNFAQGAMVLTAALALVRSLEVLQDQGLPFWLAVVLAFLFAAVVMALIAWAVERFVLRKLVNQEGIILFMATLGVTFFIDGLAQTVFGSDVYPLNLGLPKDPIFILESLFDGGVLINELDIVAGAIASLLVAGLALFFQRTRVGRALRAVADDHAAAQSVGIPLNYIWLVVWLVAGLVALVAGAMWGTKLGVQFSLSLLALKALPVLILGGFTSVPGAIIGGLLIGAGEKLAEVYIGPSLGGGIEIWFAFVLALVFLLFRPQGLFGERIIERV
jgi:branched-chain amino acid transport system permease protein